MGSTDRPNKPKNSTTPRDEGAEEYARLVYRTREKKFARKDVLRNTTLIGASPRSHIQLVSDHISYAHCVISVDSGELRVRDLRSRTGTHVNGTRIDVCTLADGDKLKVGPFSFMVETNLGSQQGPASDLLMDRLNRRAEQLSSLEYAAEERGVVPFSTEFVKSLVNSGQLTRFQAEWLMEGTVGEFCIDQFKILNILGTGGMGWLYVAEFVETGENVALKVLTGYQDSGILARFQIEARAGLMLNHPNIVRTYKMAQSDDVHYVVMELVEGISAHEMVDLRKKILWQQACDIALQAANGLQHAHEAGLVHRDVKPANLLIEQDGHVKILDFGLALLDNDDDEFSLAMITGQDCMGTADYMAPEQSLDSYNVDARADIYSLGCTLYFLLTSQVPFPEKSTSEKLKAQRTKPARSVRVFSPSVPQEIADIVKKMMAKQPGQRFESAAEVAAALAPFSLRSAAAFDFQTLLRTRMVEARQRIAVMQKRQASGSKSGSLTKVDHKDGSSSVGTDGRRTPSPSQTLSHDSTRPKMTTDSELNPFQILRKACAGLPDEAADLSSLVAAWPTLDAETRKSLIAILDGSAGAVPPSSYTGPT